MENFSLKGRKAIVTGGSRGLGKSMATALLEAGAEVVIFGTSRHVDDTVLEFEGCGFLAHGMRTDIGSRKELQGAYEQALGKLGGTLDILVNAAGVQRRNSCEVFSLTDWDDVLSVNLTAMFQLCQLAGRTMLERGQGKIINIASMLSFFGGYTVPAYAASKGGVAQLTKALANEWASRGINVNAIAPGYMATEMNEEIMADAKRNRDILARIPQGRWGTGEDMKGIVVFLASEASSYMNGAVIPVDGGYLGR